MRSPCTSILSTVVVCGSGLGPEATPAASAPAGTPSARLVSRVAAVRDCGGFVLGTACLRLLMWALGVFVEWATRGRTHARWRRRASGTWWVAWGGGLGADLARFGRRRGATAVVGDAEPCTGEGRGGRGGGETG